MRLVDYVVAHEVVHLVHRNHTAAYWGALAKLVPEVDARRAELRERGKAFDLVAALLAGGVPCPSRTKSGPSAQYMMS
jgi:hypothetical protein